MDRLSSVVAFIAVWTSLLLLPLPQLGRAGATFLDLAHAPACAMLAVVIHLFLRSRGATFRTHLAVFALLLVFCAGTEVAQGWIGRDSNWWDLLSNVLGTCIGSSWFLLGPRRSLLVGLSCLLLTVAWARPSAVLYDGVLRHRQFPTVASFEQPVELLRWHALDAEMQRTSQHVAEGKRALKVTLCPGTYPGVILFEPYPDWRAYDQLEMSIWLEGEEPFELWIKIEDEEHDGAYQDRFHEKLVLQPGDNHIRTLLSKVRTAPATREMNLSQISVLQLFAVKLTQSRTMFVDHIRVTNSPR